MLVFLFVGLLACFLGAKPAIRETFPVDGSHCSRDTTTMINGLFIWIVFTCHIAAYRPAFDALDRNIVSLMKYGGQCCVATFFFYSGYGIMCSLQNKGKAYAFELVYKRFTLVLLHFSLAVLIYWGVRYLMGTTFPIERVLFSLIAWESIGNSNWFIFITLIAYLIIAFNYLLFSRFGHALVVTGVLLSLCALAPILAPYGRFFVDSFFCIPAGMVYALYIDKIDGFFYQNLKCPVWLIGCILIPIALMTYRCPGLENAWKNVGTVLFAIAIHFFFQDFLCRRNLCSFAGAGGLLYSIYTFFKSLPCLSALILDCTSKFPSFLKFSASAQR